MPSLTEYSFVMDLDPVKGVNELYDGPAINNDIAEWLATPVGTVADWPTWGNELFKFKHDPTDVNLAVGIELHIIQKLPVDVKDVKIRSILVGFTEIDQCVVYITHGYGTYQGVVDR